MADNSLKDYKSLSTIFYKLQLFKKSNYILLIQGQLKILSGHDFITTIFCSKSTFDYWAGSALFITLSLNFLSNFFVGRYNVFFFYTAKSWLCFYPVVNAVIVLRSKLCYGKFVYLSFSMIVFYNLFNFPFDLDLWLSKLCLKSGKVW